MRYSNFGAFARIFDAALIAVAIWAYATYEYAPPPRPADAPATAFSADRAYVTLGRVLVPERTHSVGTPENAAVRARIIAEFARLGVKADTYSAFACNPWRGFRFIPCATVTDIIAEILPGKGKAVVMLAHYDSVPAGPGASDDGSGVATVLESARALRARGGTGQHPVIALLTDGEEGGLLGAQAFLNNPALRARAGAVVNVEARGTSGPSQLFQTSAGSGRLIDLYAEHVPLYATSSLYAEIFKFLPNDTDLTLFIRAGITSFNFAFSDNVRYYHSPLDLRSNLNRASLQMHGDNLIGVVTGLEQTGFAALKGGNDVYLSVLGKVLPRIPESWALPLAVIVFLAIAAASFLAREDDADWRGVLSAAFMPLVLLVGSALVGWLLAFIAQLVSGQPDPTYAYPLAMRIALGVGVLGMTVAVSRAGGTHRAASSAWLWIAGLGIVTAAFAPGISPYFLFPGIIAAVLLLATARLEGGWNGPWGQLALLIGALSGGVIWFSLVGTGETLMGLGLHPLFTIPAAFGALAIVPLLAARPLARDAWPATIIVCFLVAIGGAVVAGLTPAYSALSPQRLNILYFESAGAPAHWIADTSWKATKTEPLPRAFEKAGNFAYSADAYPGLEMGDAFTAPAGTPRYPLPQAMVTEDRQAGAVHIVGLQLRGSPETGAMMLHIPAAAHLAAVRMRGQFLAVPKDWSGANTVTCLGPDCRDLEVTLAFLGAGPTSLNFAEMRFGLPQFGAALKSARPDIAMPSQSGDGVILANTVSLRAR